MIMLSYYDLAKISNVSHKEYETRIPHYISDIIITDQIAYGHDHSRFGSP